MANFLADRGFLDGATLYWLDQQGIAFVVPAKKKMLVHRLACSEAQGKKGHVQSRTRTVTHGHGKRKSVEHLTTEVVGIENLQLWDAYNDPKAARKARRRGYESKPLQAIVVRMWENRPATPGGTVVFLTNQQVRTPLSVFDDYDGRSLIENTLFREGKQGWALESIPQKNQRAAVSHIFITLAMVAITTAYREWTRREAEEEAEASSPLERRLGRTDLQEPQGIRRWRRDLKNAVRDDVIVFQGPSYGIFHVMEMMVLAGYRLRRLPEELGAREAIFARYGIHPPP
ncbi:transposase [Limnochorda pilosa]|uniref:Transposase IS4-like domain-containing protein n=1 Tax=Limnochorda pilosa TaxID=1555112 RepID=A0A0K2SMW6_LIMPI|nr:transposase [Limnochorda pilosa]BAS28144.1 hypothetical protein LIP_2303 [Limnochorda pilosa]